MQKLGNWQEAQKELQADTNNALKYLFQTKNENKGVLQNAVFTIKDNIATKNAPTTASSKILEGFQPSYDATIVEKLVQAGALPIAKVNHDELALGGTGTFSAFGLITNPLDSQRLVGGSSSGSVATFTKNIAFSLGSDTGDSVRLPASYNGVVGFKPSYGAISRYGLFAYASSLDTHAYFTHSVNDAALVSQVVYGKDSKDMTSKEVAIANITELKPKKVVALNLSSFVEPYVADAYEKLLDQLKSKNVEVELVSVNQDILRAIKPVYDIISYSEASSNLANLNGIAFGNRQDSNNWADIMTQTRTKNFGEMVQRRLTLGSFYLYTENQEKIFIKAQKVRRVIKNYLEELQRKGDILIYPASAAVAPYIDSSKNKSYDFMDYILTGANLVGNPSLSIPLAKKDHLPFNLAIDSFLYNDEKLLSHALWVEGVIQNGGNDEK
ncbi:Asp-tRNA(Asn)/Glu-tRNA(Gln) amidotransferase GatCAB subunit A [Mycoplasma sp. Ms02]|nr:Asp-tRNA(Asn)/Glu-tRNA(Gln) amidotransferase GatCAB subunit A [Mycoplasma sp. Ms02]